MPAESYLLCLSLLVNLIRGLSQRVLEIPWKGNKLQQVLESCRFVSTLMGRRSILTPVSINWVKLVLLDVISLRVAESVGDVK